MLTLEYQKIKNALENLHNASIGVKEALLVDNDFDAFLPTSEPGTCKRTAVINSITDFYNKDPLEQSPHLIAGVFCMSEKTEKCLIHFNDMKGKFKNAIKQFREEFAKDKDFQTSGSLAKTIMKKVDSVDDVKDWEVLSKAFRSLNFTNINLVRAYATIRIIPAATNSISWSWTKHNSITKITISDAEELVNKVPLQSTRDILNDLIKKVCTEEYLAIVKPKNKQLIANCISGGKREPVKVSGVFGLSNSTLPDVLWRDIESINGDRLTRSDTIIEAEPYIRALNIHLYKKGHSNG